MRLFPGFRKPRAASVSLIAEGLAQYEVHLSRLLSMMDRKAGQIVREYLRHALHLIGDLPGDFGLFERLLEAAMRHVDHPMNRTPFYPVEQVYVAAHEVLRDAAAYAVQVELESGAPPLSWQLTTDGPFDPWLAMHGYGHIFTEYAVDEIPYPLTALAAQLILPGSFMARLPAENLARLNAAMEGGRPVLLPLVEAVHGWKLRVNHHPAEVFIGETHSYFVYPEALKIAAPERRPDRIAETLEALPHRVALVPNTAAYPLTLTCLSVPNARLAWASLDLYQRESRGDRPLWLLPQLPLFNGSIRPNPETEP
jgi:hypothetical protein